MTAQAQDTTVRTQIVVEAPIHRAFRVFTHNFDQIKPREHNMLGVDGSECQWARVIAYEPPGRIVFTWDINPYWQIETDHDKTSEVEVRFIAESPERTRVELEHRNLDRHGDGWEGMREGVRGDDGWPLYLQRFAGVALADG